MTEYHGLPEPVIFKDIFDLLIKYENKLSYFNGCLKFKNVDVMKKETKHYLIFKVSKSVYVSGLFTGLNKNRKKRFKRFLERAYSSHKLAYETQLSNLKHRSLLEEILNEIK